MQHYSICVKHESLEDIGGKYSKGGIHRSGAIDRTFKDHWFPRIHPCVCGEEDKDGALHDLHISTEDDNFE